MINLSGKDLSGLARGIKLFHQVRNAAGSDLQCEDCRKPLTEDSAATQDNGRAGKALCESCFHKRGMRHSSDKICPKCGMELKNSEPDSDPVGEGFLQEVDLTEKENANNKCEGCNKDLQGDVWDSYATGKKWCKDCDATKAAEFAEKDNCMLQNAKDGIVRGEKKYGISEK